MMLKSALLRSIKRHGRTRAAGSATMAKLASWYLDGYDNIEHDPRANGELRVLQVLSRFEPKLIFDIGANVGDWTMLALESGGAAKIHCFEVASPTFERLSANLSDNPRTQLNPFGLSDANGEIEIKYYPANIGVTTGILSESIHGGKFEIMRGVVRSGDEYVAEQGIDQIDMVKVDVEGMEMQVFRGLGETFARQAITAVQFEYGMANIYSRALLKDLFEFFENRGYVVGKIFPTRVAFEAYSPKAEDFRGPNFLAVRREAPELVECLAG